MVRNIARRPERSSRRSDNAKEPRRPRTFKPRRPEIGTWKTNTFKATGRLVKSSPTFDQLLSKYVKKKAGITDRPRKRPRLPTQEQQQVRPIGPPHQSEKTGDHNVQLRPNVPAWTPLPPYPPMPYPYTYIPPPYLPNQMWGMPPYQFGMPQYPTWGAPQTSIFNRLTPTVQDLLRAPQSGPRAQAQQDCRTTRPQRLTDPTEGHTATASNSAIKGDIIKIGTTDVVVQQNNEGAMIFGESANTNEKEGTSVNKTADPKYSMPRWYPSGLTRSQKRKLQRLRAKENQEKEVEKIFNDTQPQYPPPQKRWRPKVVEKNQTATKVENKMTTVQLSAGMLDSSTIKARSSAQDADHPTSKAGPSALHQDTSNDVPTPMEEDDLQGEDLVDYGAMPEHLEN
jgi:hypothetical protein